MGAGYFLAPGSVGLAFSWDLLFFWPAASKNQLQEEDFIDNYEIDSNQIEANTPPG